MPTVVFLRRTYNSRPYAVKTVDRARETEKVSLFIVFENIFETAKDLFDVRGMMVALVTAGRENGAQLWKI